MSQKVDNRKKLGEMNTKQHIELVKNSERRKILDMISGMKEEGHSLEMIMFVLGQEYRKSLTTEQSIMSRLRQKYSESLTEDDNLVIKSNGEIVVGEK